MTFAITTDYIKLDSFLKAVNVVGSGGEAKIIIASGYSMSVQEGEAREIGAKAFNDKPYDVQRMLEAVRKVLDSPAGIDTRRSRPVSSAAALPKAARATARTR